MGDLAIHAAGNLSQLALLVRRGRQIGFRTIRGCPARLGGPHVLTFPPLRFSHRPSIKYLMRDAAYEIPRCRWSKVRPVELNDVFCSISQPRETTVVVAKHVISRDKTYSEIGGNVFKSPVDIEC